MVGVADVLHRSVGVVQVGLDDEGVDPLLQREGRRPSVEDGEEDPFLRVDVLAIGDVGEELDAFDRTVVGQRTESCVNNSRPSDSQAVEQRLRSGNKSRRRRMSGSL
jgi:hypothetical protein